MAYSDLLIWQYRGKPKAKATAEIFDDLLANSLSDTAELINVLNIDEAIGVNLDLVGKHIGQSRILQDYAPIGFFGFVGGYGAMPFSRNGEGGGKWYRLRDPIKQSTSLGDTDYRFLLKGRILKNYQTASVPDVTNAARMLLGSNVTVIDNYNMTVDIKISKEYESVFKKYVIEKLDILPRQAGVKYNYIWGEIPRDIHFGFLGADTAGGFSRQRNGGAKFKLLSEELENGDS